MRFTGVRNVAASGVAFLAALAFQAVDCGPANAGYPALFGSKEVRSKNLKPFPKWTGVVDRYFEELDVPEGSCKKTFFTTYHLEEWEKFLTPLRSKGKKAQLEEVNRFMNRAPYIADPRNYLVPDYWATPRQFMNRNGDCEDYAIAKYMSLRALGWTNENLRILVLQDLNLRVAHAVLIAYSNGKAYLLDNQIEQVVATTSVRHYQPIYSVNEDNWWLHRQ